MPLTQKQITDILKNVSIAGLYNDALFLVLPRDSGFHLQLIYQEEDIENPGVMQTQKARKWYISPHATKSEVVQTAFKAVMTSMEHRVREHFLYRDARIMSPHFDVDERVKFCKLTELDLRQAPPDIKL